MVAIVKIATQRDCGPNIDNKPPHFALQRPRPPWGTLGRAPRAGGGGPVLRWGVAVEAETGEALLHIYIEVPCCSAPRAPTDVQGEQNTMPSSKAIKKSRRFFWYLFGERA
jgi:hypothetical protein